MDDRKRTSNGILVVGALCAALLVGCGGGGGGGGSGATSTISGNVSNASTALLAHPRPTLLARVLRLVWPVGEAYAGRNGIHVTVNGVETDTDATGFFTISGPFSGPVTVSFGQGNRTFTMQVDVPSGATIVLRDVSLRDDGTAHAASTGFHLRGTVAAVTCDSVPRTLTVALAGGDALVGMDAGTRIQVSGEGSSNDTCEGLAASIGQSVRVEGDRASDGTLVADRVKVHPTAAEEDDRDDVEFRGTVSSLACPDSITVTRTDGESVLVHLGSSTEIDGATACGDLAGASVKVEGKAEADGSVTAKEIHVGD